MNKLKERGYLVTIAVLLELVKNPDGSKPSQGQLVDTILTSYDDLPGISQNSLQQRFSAARTYLATLHK